MPASSKSFHKLGHLVSFNQKQLVKQTAAIISILKMMLHSFFPTVIRALVFMLQIPKIPYEWTSNRYLTMGSKKTGKVSVLVIAGFWMLEEIAAQETLVTYQILAKPGGSIPAWVAHSAAVDTPFKSLKSLRAYLKYLQKGDRQMLIVTKLEV